MSGNEQAKFHSTRMAPCLQDHHGRQTGRDWLLAARTREAPPELRFLSAIGDKAFAETRIALQNAEGDVNALIEPCPPAKKAIRVCKPTGFRWRIAKDLATGAKD